MLTFFYFFNFVIINIFTLQYCIGFAIHQHTHCCSVTRLCLTLCNPMDCSAPGFPVLHSLPEFTQTHVYWVSDAIQPPHPWLPPSPPALNLSQHQSFFFQWVSSLHQRAKVSEFSFTYIYIFQTVFCYKLLEVWLLAAMHPVLDLGG